jgi:hypothetical protein
MIFVNGQDNKYFGEWFRPLQLPVNICKERAIMMTGKQPEFFKNLEQDGRTYEMYMWEDPQAARLWLMEKTVDKPLHYITIKTDQGVWGVDKDGLYLANLLPWQTNLSLAKQTGQITGIPAMASLASAVNNIADNFIAHVQCGNTKCEFIWQDGLRYQNKTVVRCPECKEYSLIDSSNVRSL